jgi:hypothetical protein
MFACLLRYKARTLAIFWRKQIPTRIPQSRLVMKNAHCAWRVPAPCQIAESPAGNGSALLGLRCLLREGNRVSAERGKAGSRSNAIPRIANTKTTAGPRSTSIALQSPLRAGLRLRRARDALCFAQDDGRVLLLRMDWQGLKPVSFC